MSAFSRFISGAARSFGPIATSIAPVPAKPVVNAIVGDVSKGEEARKREEKLATMIKMREQNMNYSDLTNAEIANLGKPNSGFGSGFGNFLTQASTNILNPLTNFASGISNLFGRNTRPSSTVLQPALTTVTNVGAQESQTSGVNEAFIGGIPNLIGTASRLLRSPRRS